MKNVRNGLKKDGYALFHYDDQGIVHSYPYDAPWLTDVDFSELYSKIRKHTLVDRTRCHSLYRLCQQAKKIKGDVLEVGVWRGGTGAILADCLKDRLVYLADTFRGVVKSSDWEHYDNAAHSDTSVSTVTDLFSSLGLSNYSILEGIFPEETSCAVMDTTFSLVHIDVDV